MPLLLKYRLILLFLFLPFSVVTYGQYFKKLGIKEGLSNLSVLSIYQDTLGRMWFGTNEGVNVYDGTQIEKIKSYEMTSPDGAVVKKFMNGRVNQIVGDCSGRVYINNNGALVEYDVLTERFTEI